MAASHNNQRLTATASPGENAKSCDPDSTSNKPVVVTHVHAVNIYDKREAPHHNIITHVR